MLPVSFVARSIFGNVKSTYAVLSFTRKLMIVGSTEAPEMTSEPTDKSTITTDVASTTGFFTELTLFAP